MGCGMYVLFWRYVQPAATRGVLGESYTGTGLSPCAGTDENNWGSETVSTQC
jgi:hypothetical protein